MEELLNKLIEKGWKPRNREKTLHINIFNECKDMNYTIHLDWWFMNEDDKSIRELVSKESGLWQFICENKLLNEDKCWVSNYNRHKWVKDDFDTLQYWDKVKLYSAECWYWLIESALCDEEDLEKFLLDNIKI